jgi:hypothetical protein
LEMKDWQIAKDRQRLVQQIREERDKSKPDAEIIAGLRSNLAAINNEIRRRGKSGQPVTAADDAARSRIDRNAGTYNSERAGQPVDLEAIYEKRHARDRAEKAKLPVMPIAPQTAEKEPLPIEECARLFKTAKEQAGL